MNNVKNIALCTLLIMGTGLYAARVAPNEKAHCLICLEAPNGVMVSGNAVFRCHHGNDNIYHLQCLKGWINTHGSATTCPLCRAHLINPDAPLSCIQPIKPAPKKTTVVKKQLRKVKPTIDRNLSKKIQHLINSIETNLKKMRIQYRKSVNQRVRKQIAATIAAHLRMQKTVQKLQSRVGRSI